MAFAPAIADRITDIAEGPSCAKTGLTQRNLTRAS